MIGKDMPDVIWLSEEEKITDRTGRMWLACFPRKRDCAYKYIRADLYEKRVKDLLQSNNDKLEEIRRLKDELKVYKETQS